MKVTKLILTCLLIAISTSGFAQTNLAAKFDSLSLKSQFDYVFEKSSSYEQYKVVKISTYNLLKKNSLDSIGGYKSELSDKYKEIKTLNATVQEKDAKIKELSDNLTATTNTKNSMQFLGMDVAKGAYNSIMWGLVFGLVAIAIVLFLMFKRSNSVTSETKQRLNEVEEEYESHRKSALKREQKLARELMDEKLKHKF